MKAGLRLAPCPHCGEDSVLTPENRLHSTAADAGLYDAIKAGTWGFDWCRSCRRFCRPTLPLITHIAEHNLLVMISPKDRLDLVDVFRSLMDSRSGEVTSEIYARLLTYPFQIVIGVEGFKELVRGVTQAPRNLRYFPGSYEHEGPPKFSISQLKSTAKEYERAGRVAEGLAMFERLAEFPVGDAEYLRIWASMAIQENQLELAGSLLDRVEAIERQTKHAWQVVIPQMSAMQEISPVLCPPILAAEMIDRLHQSEPEYQISDHGLARVAGAIEREIWTAHQVLGGNSSTDHHVRNFLLWALNFPSPVREDLMAAYSAEGGSSFKIVSEP